MSIYAIGVRTVPVGINTYACRLISATKDCRVLEVGFCMAATTQSTIGLGRHIGGTVTSSATSTVQAEQAGTTAGTAVVETNYSTNTPTAITNFLRRWTLPATIGAGMVWTFPRPGLLIRAGTTTDYLAVFNISAIGVMDVYFVVEE